MNTYTKKILLKWFSLWAAGNALVGILLLCLLPSVYGWLTGNVIGLVLGGFLARHDTLLYLTEQLLRGGYTLLALVGFDFLFLFMVYTAVNTVFERGGTRKDIACVAGRALKGLFVSQLIFGVIFLLLTGAFTHGNVYVLIPAFLTQNIPSIVYMMIWVLSLVWFALGYALTENSRQAWMMGKQLFGTHFIWLFAASGLCMLLTGLPALCLSQSVPAWVLVMFGVAVHTVFINGGLLLLFKQPNIAVSFKNPSTPQA